MCIRCVDSDVCLHVFMFRLRRSMNHIVLSSLGGTRWAGGRTFYSANTRCHQPCWDDWERGFAFTCSTLVVLQVESR